MSKTAFITGASGGIGSAIAAKLASAGYTLILHYHSNHTNAARLQKQLTEEYQVPVSILSADLSTDDGLTKLIASFNQSPDILIHNAGVGHYGLFTEIDKTDYDKMLQLHLTSPFMLTQHCLPKMISKKWGRIIFITSIWGETGAACETL